MTKTKLMFIFTLLTHLTVCQKAKQKPPRAAYFLCSEISYNPLYLAEHFMVIAPNRLTVNITLNLAQDFLNDPWADISLATKNRKDNTYRTLFQYDVNVCYILGNQDNKNPFNKFVRGWIHNVWKYGNLPEECPIKKNNYSFINLKPEKLYIPNFIPLGKYRAIINTYFRKDLNKDSIANFTVYVDIK